jgi:RIP metalloprotease RseP
MASGLPQALRMASSDFARLTGVVTHGLSEIVLHFSDTVDQISGPVAIVAVGAQVARGDPAGIFQFASIININLAVVNLLPLPALDGGFLALLALEGARGGKKLDVEVEQAIMGSGLLLLIASGVVLLVRDTLNLEPVRNLLQ